MRRLHFTLFFGFIGIAITVALASHFYWAPMAQGKRHHDIEAILGRMTQDAMVSTQDPQQLNAQLHRWRLGTPFELTVLTDTPTVHDDAQPSPHGDQNWNIVATTLDSAQQHRFPVRHTFQLDAHTKMQVSLQKRRPFFPPLLYFIMVALIVSFGSMVLAKTITRRLSRLDRSVQRFAEGDFSARVSVHGRDEVARLSKSFNLAAEKIAELFATQARILAMTSHEFRTPLARMRMALSLAQPDNASDPHLAELDQNISELDALVEETLLAARIESGQWSAPTRIDALPLIRQEAARAGIELSIQPDIDHPNPPEKIWVEGHHAALKRALVNLLENAKQHRRGEGSASATLRIEAGQLVLHIENPGAAFDARTQAKLFEPFFRAPTNRSESTGGMGLYLAQKVAQAQGGALSYSYDVQTQRHRFSLRLPQAA